MKRSNRPENYLGRSQKTDFLWIARQRKQNIQLLLSYQIYYGSIYEDRKTKRRGISYWTNLVSNKFSSRSPWVIKHGKINWLNPSHQVRHYRFVKVSFELKTNYHQKKNIFGVKLSSYQSLKTDMIGRMVSQRWTHPNPQNL